MIGSPTLRKLGGTLKLREQGGSVLTLTEVPGYGKWLHLPVTFQQDISKSKAVRALAAQSAKKKSESGAFKAHQRGGPGGGGERDQEALLRLEILPQAA